MLSKNRTYLLLIVLVIAVGIYFLLTFTQDRERNFRTSFIDFDTTLVNRIEIVSPSPAEKIILLKESGSWKVKLPNNQYAADFGSIKNLMMQLDGAKIRNVAANSKSDWEQFKTTDAQGTRIQFMKDGDILSNIILGRFDYIQPKSQQQPNPYMRKPQGEMLSYARIAGEEAVYTIDGMISIGIGKSPDDYRNKKITSLIYDNINELNFNYADGKPFKLYKEAGKWFLNGAEADSATTVKYLKSITNLRGKDFYDGFFQNENPYSKLTILQSSGDPIEINTYVMDTSSFVLSSSINSTNLILDADKKITEKLFVSKEYLMGNEN